MIVFHSGYWPENEEDKSPPWMFSGPWGTDCTTDCWASRIKALNEILDRRKDESNGCHRI